MTTYFQATFADGKVEVRSTASRTYAACFFGRYGVSWAGRLDLVPAGVKWARAVEITADAYRAIILARDVAKAGGSETAAKLKKARAALGSGQRDQKTAFRVMNSLRDTMAAGLAPDATQRQQDDLRSAAGFGRKADVERIGRPYASAAECVAKIEARIVGQQIDQANAYKRIAQAVRAINRLEGAAE